MAGGKGRRTFSFSDSPKRCFGLFDEMRSAKRLCDITFNLGKETISAHRVILAAAIPYFQRAFSEGRDEIPHIEPTIFTCLIDYAYTFEVNINTTNVENLLAAACCLGIVEVKQACCEFLFSCLTPDSAWNVRELAVRFNSSELLADTDNYIMEKFNVISQTRDFLKYSWTYLKQLTAKDELHVRSEKEVLEAVLRWVKESPEDRRNQLPELLYNVRMPLLEPQYLMNIATTEIIRTLPSCRDIIDEAKSYNSFPQMRRKRCCFKTLPRESKTEILKREEEVIQNPCIYMFSAVGNFEIECFNLLKEELTTKKMESFGPDFNSAVRLQNKIYLFTGSTMQQYCLRDSKFIWDSRNMPNMPIRREYFGATAFKNKVYVCGGVTDRLEASNVVQFFDANLNQWETAKSMPTSRAHLRAITWGKYIYTLGGKNNGIVLNYVERYDSKRDKWTCMSPMLKARESPGAAALNGKIYVCGGYFANERTTAEAYDPIDDQWVFISPTKAPKCSCTLMSCQGKLYATDFLLFGTFLGNPDPVEVYDPESDEWMYYPQLKPSRSCVVVMGPGHVNKK